MKKKYDFGGYATRINLKCGDGRTIRHGAFDDDNGRRVPFVWQHQHDAPENVIGHADLESRNDGMYAYVSLNGTARGKLCKELVQHGDVSALSIYANHLTQRGGDVLRGAIKEVSLVLAGANPGAFIETATIQHGDDILRLEDEAIIYGGSDVEMATYDDKLRHADDSEEENENRENSKGETIGDVFNTLSEKQKKAVYALIGSILEDQKKGGAKKDDSMQHADDDSEDSEETVQDVFNTLTEKQKQAVYAIVGSVVEDEKTGEVEHSDMEDEEDMINHNVFDRSDRGSVKRHGILQHSEWNAIVSDAKACGSLKTAYLAHADDMTNGEAGRTYGIGNLELMFPEYRDIRNQPDLIKQDDAWVAGVISGVNKTPFARIRTSTVDITADVARARGYKKGHLKKEEVVKMARRITGPTTIYKKQKLDHDDLVDLEGSGFDAVAFLKSEMQGKLREELARAILLSDGRADDDEDKIDEACIRPIIHEDEFYAYSVEVDMNGDTDDDTYGGLVDQIPMAMLDYKGSGAPTMFTNSKVHAKMRMVKDKIGRKIYQSESDLTGTLGVSSIVDVPYMNDLYDADGNEILAIIVNLKDYTIGTNRGGETKFFDDFDIDYNQYKYLYETRLSGALTRPDCAIIVKAANKPPVKLEFEMLEDADTFTDLGDMTVNELQSDVQYTEGNGFSGNLHYVESWPEFSTNPSFQSGNYLAFSIVNSGSDTNAKIYVGLTNGLVQGLKEVDETREVVLRITDEMKQKIKIKAVDSNGKSTVKLYNLTGLNLEKKPV